MDREKAFYESKKMLGCLIGVFIYSVGINLFVVPAKLYPYHPSCAVQIRGEPLKVHYSQV